MGYMKFDGTLECIKFICFWIAAYDGVQIEYFTVNGAELTPNSQQSITTDGQREVLHIGDCIAKDEQNNFHLIPARFAPFLDPAKACGLARNVDTEYDGVRP